MAGKRCPYSDCQQDAAGPLSHHVHLCSQCDRLSLACENQQRCRALNRPFSLHCRCCPDNMLTREWAGSAKELWDDAARPAMRQLPQALGAPSTVVGLSDLHWSQPLRAPLAMRFIEGLLAVHQAGAFIALFHPFRDLTTDRWRRERPLLEHEDRGACRPNWQPFPPLRMSDDRHVVFATPSSIYAVHVWSLRDWACAQERPRCYHLVDCGAEGTAEIATAPIPLGGALLGVVSRSAAGAYFWTVINLAQATPTSAPLRDLAAGAVPLPLRGQPCHAEGLEGEAIMFATPEGHWLWHMSDAAQGTVSELRPRVPQADADQGKLEIHRHVVSPGDFHSARHIAFCPPKPSRSAPQKCTYYYRYRNSPVAPLWCYEIDCQTLETTDATPLDVDTGTIPLGVQQLSPKRRRVLFCSGKELRFDAGLRLEPLPGHGHIDLVEQSLGYTFCDPLLAVLRADQRPGENVLVIRSMNLPNEMAAFELPALLCDPLIWSHWLFTIEAGGDGRALLLCRRDLMGAADARDTSPRTSRSSISPP